MAADRTIRLGVIEGIAEVTLDRPPLNVLNIAMMGELDSALESVARADVAAIVLRGEGRAFSAGVDVADHTDDKAEEMIRVFHGIFRKLAATDALTISVAQGAALGGGCELACFCDIVLASDKARFGQPEVKVGVFPPVAACALPLRLGLARAVELAALGEVLPAAEAHRIGLVNHVYPVEEFPSKVEAYLAGIRNLSRPVVRAAKRATWLAARGPLLEHLDRAEQVYLNELMETRDAHEGIQAFLSKRAPVWNHA
jgi:cyclohexa-1,5-dienecarbonyl-CoA hydratase